MLPKPVTMIIAGCLALVGTLMMYLIDKTIVPLFKQLPDTFVPKSWPERRLEKDFSFNISSKTFKFLYECYYKRQFGVRVGDKAPNPEVILSDGTRKLLLDHFERQDRLLVVMFGSCTCPPFMSKLDRFNEMVSDYIDYADFVTVYIKEAHPSDEWNLGTNEYVLEQHQNIEEKWRAAAMLEERLHKACSMVVDTIENEAANLYSAVPEAIYIVDDGTVWLRKLGPFRDAEDIYMRLEQRLNKLK